MAAQSSLDLSTPFRRLNALPTAVNWRNDVWSPTTVYFRNDVVVSPITNGSYINITPTTTILGGGDPSTNPTAWYEFGGSGGGVQEIQGSEYITVGPTSTPEITNNGVCEMDIGQNLNNLGTQNDPILEDLGVSLLFANPGISVAGSAVANAGVIHLNGGSGMTVTGVSELSLSYTGVSAISPSNASITVGAGTSPLISNTGLLSLTTSTGLVNSSTAQTPNISNGGVIDISGGTTVLVTDFPNIKLATIHPSISLIGTLVNANMVPNPTISNDVVGRIPVTQIPGSVWATSIATQLPYSSGTFTINISLGCTVNTGSSLNMGASKITIYDSINNVAYTPIVSEEFANNIFHNRTYIQNSIQMVFLEIVVDIATLWASGFREMTHIQVTQISVDPALTARLFMKQQGTNVYAVYNREEVNRF